MRNITTLADIWVTWMKPPPVSPCLVRTGATVASREAQQDHVRRRWGRHYCGALGSGLDEQDYGASGRKSRREFSDHAPVLYFAAGRGSLLAPVSGSSSTRSPGRLQQFCRLFRASGAAVADAAE